LTLPREPATIFVATFNNEGAPGDFMVDDINLLHRYLEKSSDQSSQDLSPHTPQIFLVEDDGVLGKTIKKFLERKLLAEINYFDNPSDCLLAIDDKKALERKEHGAPLPFCLITDISFDQGGADGLLLVDLLKEKGYDFVSIAMTGFASIETAINATKKGVFHYLTKPFELDVLAELTQKALKKIGHEVGFFEPTHKDIAAEANRNNAPFSTTFKIESPKEEDLFCGMIGRSKLMKKVFDRIEKVAASDSTVLITGPSGTGKELVSNALHNLSSRKNGPKISVNCGAIPSELLESELFGHVKGAFTGAISSRKGRFEMANQGTIFLDEIGDMPLLLQVKLLRVLQNREIERVGSTETVPVDVRIITATHHDLENAVEVGNFREDLYYRLNVIPIKVPSLCERREDIPLLISYFLSRFVSADGRNRLEFDQDALELLLTYDWPGNVRELENLIERLVILRGGNLIKAKDLPAKFFKHAPHQTSQYESLITLPDSGVDLKKALSDIEDSLIMQALDRTRGNKNQASKLLSMNRTTLIEKMKKKGLLQLN
jgi:two-component system, NtrC family, response regulator PilR